MSRPGPAGRSGCHYAKVVLAGHLISSVNRLTANRRLMIAATMITFLILILLNFQYPP
ncbi:MAG: hypothetical protein AB1632_12855 [Nitrospirota bacterium]